PRALDPVHQAGALDRPVRTRIGSSGLRAAEARAVVLPPLRRPGDRAGDQARLRVAVRAHVARRTAHSHAVLPAFILGLVLSEHYATHRREQERLRLVAFAFLTPFFFLKG